jgi:hypothetical protein
MLLIVIVLAGLIVVFGTFLLESRQHGEDRRKASWWIMLALGLFSAYTFVRILRFFPTSTIVGGCALGLFLGVVVLGLSRRAKAVRSTGKKPQ